MRDGVRTGARMQCQPVHPRDREGEVGRGDTAQLRLQKRARAQVSPLISALAKNMQI